MKKPYNLIRFFLLLFNLLTYTYAGYSIYLNPSNDLFLNILMAGFICLIVLFFTIISFYHMAGLQHEENELKRKQK